MVDTANQNIAKTDQEVADKRKMQRRLCDIWAEAVTNASLDPKAFASTFTDIPFEKIRAIETARDFSLITASLGAQSDIPLEDRKELLQQMRGFVKAEWEQASKVASMSWPENSIYDMEHEQKRERLSIGALGAIDLAIEAMNKEM